MNRSLVSLALLFALTLGLCASASAATEVLYGPQTFVRKAGTPETQSVTITIPAAASNLVLWVKATSKENQEIKNVSVAFNGSEVVTQDQLQQQNPQTLRVSASGSATLDVLLKGKPGDAVTIYLAGDIENVINPPHRR